MRPAARTGRRQRAAVAQQTTGVAIRGSLLGLLATALTLGGARLLLTFPFGGRKPALGLGFFASALDLLLLRERRLVTRSAILSAASGGGAAAADEPTR
jgi:hypothetical protein